VCAVAECPYKTNEGNAVWPNSTAGSTVQGTCIEENGFTGVAVRTCSQAGVWEDITTPCQKKQPPCPAFRGYQSRTDWPETVAGKNATGSCTLGYQPAPGSDGPIRFCDANGNWTAEVINDCVVGTCKQMRSQSMSIDVLTRRVAK